MVPINEETDIIRIEGFTAKPEFSKKKRGEQFFFVNDRFIKSSYLHHAVTSAFDGYVKFKESEFQMLFEFVISELYDIEKSRKKRFGLPLPCLFNYILVVKETSIYPQEKRKLLSQIGTTVANRDNDNSKKFTAFDITRTVSKWFEMIYAAEELSKK